MIDRTGQALWLLVAVLLMVFSGLFFLSSSFSMGKGNVSALMPMYTFDSLQIHSVLHNLAIPITPEHEDLDWEAHGSSVIEALGQTAYFGPTLGPEEIAYGLLLLIKQPDLAPDSAQAQRLTQYIEYLNTTVPQIRELAVQIGDDADQVQCLFAELVQSLDEQTPGNDWSSCQLPSSQSGDLWQQVKKNLVGRGQ